MPAKVAILSHRSGNIGHHFMADGVENLLANYDGQLSFEHFAQHKHFSVHPKWNPLRIVDRFEHGKAARLRNLLVQKPVREWAYSMLEPLCRYQFAVACGGPNIVRGVGYSREMRLMFHHFYGAFTHKKVPVFDLSLGSCFPLESIPETANEAFEEADVGALKGLFEATHVTTVRDRLAKKLLGELGRDADTIPCPAFLSAWGRSPSKLDDEGVILINFQRKGANTDWGQKVDVEKWQKDIARVASALGERNEVEFICHNKVELDLAETFFPEYRRHMPETTRAYFDLLENCKLGLVNRIHAAIPMSSMGIPVLAVGTDTRTWSLQEFGIETRFVKDFDIDWAVAVLNHKLEERYQEQARLLALRSETMEKYHNLLNRHL
jgi:polysaccharide pyruvyl transferase WcaK-like protein